MEESFFQQVLQEELPEGRTTKTRERAMKAAYELRFM